MSGVVHLRDRADRRTLLAWPLPGAPSSTTSLAADATARSGLTPDGGWLLRTDQTTSRTLSLQVALAQRPCQLLVNGRPAGFQYAAGVLRATVRLAVGTVRAVTRCQVSAPPPGLG